MSKETEVQYDMETGEVRAAAPLATRPEPTTVVRIDPRPAPAPQAQGSGVRTSDQTDALFAALCAAQSDFGEVLKTRTAKIRAGYEYKYANLADVMRAVGPAMRQHGLVAVQVPMGNRVYIRLVHGPSGQWIEAGLPLVLPDHGADIQRLGSALTYLRRYLLTMLLGVVADDADDDDGAAAMPQRTR